MWLNGTSRCVFVVQLDDAMTCVCVCCTAQCVYAMWFNGASRCVCVVQFGHDVYVCVVRRNVCMLCGSMVPRGVCCAVL